MSSNDAPTVVSVVVISRNEPALDETLAGVLAQTGAHPLPCEVVVVDASAGSLDHIRARHPAVRWLDYPAPADGAVTIPQQRNVGVRRAGGQVIVFTDCGCLPEPRWLEALTAPLIAGREDAVCGRARGREDGPALHDLGHGPHAGTVYLPECPTINVGFTRKALAAVGGFDESFAYGSDIDFSWRLAAMGFRIRYAPEAIVRHDWGTQGRRLRRWFSYGRGRARLYRKHKRRLLRGWRTDAMVWAYPAFLLGLPLAVAWPPYLALLAIPAWRNRSHGSLRTVIGHLAFGAGVLAEVLS